MTTTTSGAPQASSLAYGTAETPAGSGERVEVGSPATTPTRQALNTQPPSTSRVADTTGRIYRHKENLWHDIDDSFAATWQTLLEVAGPLRSA